MAVTRNALEKAKKISGGQSTLILAFSLAFLYFLTPCFLYSYHHQIHTQWQEAQKHLPLV